MMSSAGIPLRVIQEISGHSDLGTLKRYLKVTSAQKRKAVAVSVVLTREQFSKTISPEITF
ncbi:MAG: hypothetical protein KME05_23270 [Gloeocapsa sp. UFS-A4-WI-NPMV-4B04]|jgi:site-specific recombinase XerD|nr:hypothetical protein [Gloeocapsa sp. UFS-A4-WI-NPMV-4B04]